MANNKSAKKRILTNERNRLQNRFYKTSVRTQIKLFLNNLETYKLSPTAENKEEAQKILNSVYKLIDKACKKNIFHYKPVVVYSVSAAPAGTRPARVVL